MSSPPELEFRAMAGKAISVSFLQWPTQFFIVCLCVQMSRGKTLMLEWRSAVVVTANRHFGIGPELKLRW